MPPEGTEGPLDAIEKGKLVVDYAEYDPKNPTPTLGKIEEAVNNNDIKSINRYKMTPIATGSQIIHEEAVRTVNDPNASAGDKIKAVAVDTAVQLDPITKQAKSYESLFRAIGKLARLWGEMEPEAVGGHFFDTAEGDFNSNSETLSPLNLDSALVTDAYQ